MGLQVLLTTGRPTAVERLLAVVALLGFLACEPKDTAPPLTGNATFFDWLVKASPDVISIRYDADSLAAHIEDEKDISAVLTIPGSTPQTIPIEIAARGETRKRICDVPPIHLKLPKDLRTAQGWEHLGKYKLVTHCLAADTANFLLLKEYVAYKLYELVSPHAFETLLFQLRYLPRDRDAKHYAFVIETDKELAARLECALLDETTAKTLLDKRAYQTLTLFQYMIGNTDWNLSRGHNIKFIACQEADRRIPIPYDFDASGLVNASYAVPYDRLPIRKVTERFFQYRGKKSDDFAAVVKTFLSAKSQMLQTIDSSPLPELHIRQMRAYVRDFFEIIEQEDWKENVFPATTSD